MTKAEIISELKNLALPLSSYIVFGSCPMTIAGLREAKDIDLLVTEEVYASLKKAGWKELVKGPHDAPIRHDVFEAHTNWDFSPYSPTLDHLLTTAIVIEGIPFASLEEVRKWKMASGGPKHLADVDLIDHYLASGISA